MVRFGSRLRLLLVQANRLRSQQIVRTVDRPGGKLIDLEVVGPLWLLSPAIRLSLDDESVGCALETVDSAGPSRSVSGRLPNGPFFVSFRTTGLLRGDVVERELRPRRDPPC